MSAGNTSLCFHTSGPDYHPRSISLQIDTDGAACRYWWAGWCSYGHRSLFALPTNGLLAADKSAHYWCWPRQLGCRPPEIALSHCGPQPCRWCRMAGFKCWHCIRHAPLRVLLKSLEFDPAVFEAESRNPQLQTNLEWKITTSGRRCRLDSFSFYKWRFISQSAQEPKI